MKKIILYFLAVLVVGVIGLLVGLNVDMRAVNKEAKLVERELRAMSIRLDNFSKELYPLARRIAVYHALSEGAKEKLNGLEVWQITDIIIDYCQQNEDVGFTPSVILAVWRQESNFDPDALSNKDAMGMGQVLWTTALPYLYAMGHIRPNKAIMFDPVVNAEISIKHLLRLRQFYLGIGVRDWLWVFSEYFWGRGNIGKILWYAWEVMGRVEKYKSRGVS